MKDEWWLAEFKERNAVELDRNAVHHIDYGPNSVVVHYKIPGASYNYTMLIYKDKK